MTQKLLITPQRLFMWDEETLKPVEQLQDLGASHFLNPLELYLEGFSIQATMGTLPLLSYFDRRSAILNKLNRLLPQSIVRVATFGMQSKRLVYQGYNLDQHPVVEALLQDLKVRHHPVARITFLALGSHRMLQRYLDDTCAGCVLWLSSYLGQGVRLIYQDRVGLKFTRYFPGTTPKELAAHLRETIQYIQTEYGVDLKDLKVIHTDLDTDFQHALQEVNHSVPCAQKSLDQLLKRPTPHRLKRLVQKFKLDRWGQHPVVRMLKLIGQGAGGLIDFLKPPKHERVEDILLKETLRQRPQARLQDCPLLTTQLTVGRRSYTLQKLMQGTAFVLGIGAIGMGLKYHQMSVRNQELGEILAHQLQLKSTLQGITGIQQVNLTKDRDLDRLFMEARPVHDLLKVLERIALCLVPGLIVQEFFLEQKEQLHLKLILATPRNLAREQKELISLFIDSLKTHLMASAASKFEVSHHHNQVEVIIP